MFKRLLRVFFKKSVRKNILYWEGKHHNLKVIYDCINEKYFHRKIDVSITWMRKRCFRPKARIVLGCYHTQQKIIKIHRVLDSPDIPEYFVSFVVYHEMLHYQFPPKRKFNKRSIHHQEFKIEEKKFHSFVLAKEFEKGFKNVLFSKCTSSK